MFFRSTLAILLLSLCTVQSALSAPTSHLRAEDNANLAKRQHGWALGADHEEDSDSMSKRAHSWLLGADHEEDSDSMSKRGGEEKPGPDCFCIYYSGGNYEEDDSESAPHDSNLHYKGESSQVQATQEKRNEVYYFEGVLEKDEESAPA